MAANYVLLEKITVGATTADSVTFSGIPQTGYTDLVIKFSTRDNDAGTFSHLGLTLNGDTGSNYTYIMLRGDGSSGVSTSTATTNYMVLSYGNAAGSTSNTYGIGELVIPNYTSSSRKSILAESLNESNHTPAYGTFLAGLWTGTSAITSVTLKQTLTGPFVQGSTFYLYGVAKLGTTPAIAPYATGGDTVMTDGTYWYHTFTSTGTFTPRKALTCDYLVVAGGGGAGGGLGGGGGAGGLRSTVTATGGGGSLESALSLTAQAYTVTIGAGGTSTGTYTATNGSNSVFSTITSTGGGKSGGYGSNGSTGGSGGGGGSTASGGSGTANQGYAGGTPVSGFGGGGGGANAVGGVGNAAGNTTGGAGGNGVTSSISGSSTTYAGGGGGGVSATGSTPGTGGTGGGGQGGNRNSADAVAGTANTGGGGGGGSSGNFDNAGAAGGSGIVVVRYAV